MKRVSRRKKNNFLEKNENDDFILRFIDELIGYGVFSQKDFEAGDFLLQYKGEIISESEAKKREAKYDKSNPGSFVYYGVKDQYGKAICLDATNTEGFGKMVNDAPYSNDHKAANSVMKRVVHNGVVYLCLHAIKSIKKGTEIRYDYGEMFDRMPWRKEEYYCVPFNLHDIMGCLPNEKVFEDIGKNAKVDPTDKNEVILSKENNVLVCSSDSELQEKENECCFPGIHDVSRISVTENRTCTEEVCHIVESKGKEDEVKDGETLRNATPKVNLEIRAKTEVDKHEDTIPPTPPKTLKRKSKISGSCIFDGDSAKRNIQGDATTVTNLPNVCSSTTKSVEAISNCLKTLEINLPSDLTEKIGEGTSSVVYLCTIQNKQSAVKALKQQLSMRKMIKISHKLLNIESQYILKFFGFSLKPCALIYEYCCASVYGETVTNLSQYLDVLNDENEFDFKHRLHILIQSAHGLADLHAEDVVHRDFKPSNLLVQGTPKDLRVKVGDFDDVYSIKTTISTVQTNTQKMKGMTLAYTAPEICNGKVSQASANTDVYSWAMSAFEIMAGLSTPWTNTLPVLNDALILQALQQGKRPSLKHLECRYEKNLVDSILYLLEKAWSSNLERPDIKEILCSLICIEASLENPDDDEEDLDFEISDRKTDASAAVLSLNLEAPPLPHLPQLAEDLCLPKLVEAPQSPQPLDVHLPEQLPVVDDSGFEIDSDVTVLSSTLGDNEEVSDMVEVLNEVSSNIVVNEIINSTPKTKAKNNIGSPGPKRSSKKVKVPYRKPKRLCIFCDKMLTKLSRHISKAHKQEPRIKSALKMSRRERVKVFKDIKREGIAKFNKKEAHRKNPLFQGERIRKKYFDLTCCSCCNAFISKRFFSRHTRLCKKRNDVSVVIGIPLMKDLPNDVKISNDFIQQVLYKLRDDDIGKVVRKESNILYVGSKLYRKLRHKKEKISTVRSQVRTEMRMLASLYIEFKSRDDVVAKHGSCMDLFFRENFDVMCECFDVLTTKEDSTLKSGQRKNIYYMLIRTAKRLRDKLFQEKQDDLSNELNSFLRLLKSSEDVLLSNALYNLEKAKLRKNRKPSQLPLEEDIEMINEYIQKKYTEICGTDFHFWTSTSFVELRNAAMTRLTLLNARRGGEVGRLTLEDWKEAKNDGWINSQRINVLSHADQMLVKSFKLAYQSGKGNRHLVSLLIPKDTVPALETLSDEKIRVKSGVLKENDFIFASTQQSELNFSGWHSLKEICKYANLKKPNLVTATNNRHRVSTLYAALNINEKERDLFYRHMGHSKDMNENTYQTPLGLMTAAKVGKSLLQLQGEKDGTTSEVISDSINPGKTQKGKDNDDDNLSDECANGEGSFKTLKNNFHPSKKKKLTNKEVYTSRENSEDDNAIESKVYNMRRNLPKKAADGGVIIKKGKKRPLTVKEVYTSDSDEYSENGNIKSKVYNGRGKVKRKANDGDEMIKKDLRKNVQWTPGKEMIFQRFQGFVDRSEAQPFPKRLEMVEMAEELGPGFDILKIRTKINNERKRLDEAVKRRKEDLNLSS